jgi:hypothetical protein
MENPIMLFPVLNISLPEWDNHCVEGLFLEDDRYRSKDRRFFKRYLQGHLFVDCAARIYKLTGLAESKPSLGQRLLRLHNCQLIFEATEETITLVELREIMQRGISQLDGEQAKQQWLEKLDRAESVAELLMS